MKHEQAIFASRRRALPVLVLTAAMQADAFLKDRDAAAKRRAMKGVHQIEAEARAARLGHLRKGKING